MQNEASATLMSISRSTVYIIVELAPASQGYTDTPVSSVIFFGTHMVPRKNNSRTLNDCQHDNEHSFCLSMRVLAGVK
jgi:hypothetical protein